MKTNKNQLFYYEIMIFYLFIFANTSTQANFSEVVVENQIPKGCECNWNDINYCMAPPNNTISETTEIKNNEGQLITHLMDPVPSNLSATVGFKGGCMDRNPDAKYMTKIEECSHVKCNRITYKKISKWLRQTDNSNPVTTTPTTGVTLEKKSNAIFDVIEKDYAQYFFPATGTQVSGSGNEIRYSRIYNNEYQAALTTGLNNLWYGFYGEWHRFGTLDEANEHLCNNQCWAVENQTSAADFFQESLKYEKQGLYHKALETIEKAIIIEPNNDTYLAYACHYARYTGDYEKGAEYGVKAIMINNNIGWYHVAVSWIAYIAGAMDIAKKYADSALKFGKDALGKANYDAMLIVINA
jgi:hypothetical protein